MVRGTATEQTIHLGHASVCLFLCQGDHAQPYIYGHLLITYLLCQLQCSYSVQGACCYISGAVVYECAGLSLALVFVAGCSSQLALTVFSWEPCLEPAALEGCMQVSGDAE